MNPVDHTEATNQQTSGSGSKHFNQRTENRRNRKPRNMKNKGLCSKRPRTKKNQNPKEGLTPEKNPPKLPKRKARRKETREKSPPRKPASKVSTLTLSFLHVRSLWVWIQRYTAPEKPPFLDLHFFFFPGLLRYLFLIRWSIVVIQKALVFRSLCFAFVGASDLFSSNM